MAIYDKIPNRFPAKKFDNATFDEILQYILDEEDLLERFRDIFHIINKLEEKLTPEQRRDLLDIARHASKHIHQ